MTLNFNETENERQQQREADRRQEQHQQREMEEEQTAVPSAEEEVKIYQEELEGSKNIDIFAEPPSAEFLRLMKTETEDPTTEAQVKMETMCVQQGITKSNKPFQNKAPMALDRPLEKEPRLRMNIPKPEPRG